MQQSKNIFRCVVFMSIFLYTNEMDINNLINRAGSQSELARILGVKRGTVWLWKENNKIPQSRIWQIKLLFPELLKGKK